MRQTGTPKASEASVCNYMYPVVRIAQSPLKTTTGTVTMMLCNCVFEISHLPTKTMLLLWWHPIESRVLRELPLQPTCQLILASVPGSRWLAHLHIVWSWVGFSLGLSVGVRVWLQFGVWSAGCQDTLPLTQYYVLLTASVLSVHQSHKEATVYVHCSSLLALSGQFLCNVDFTWKWLYTLLHPVCVEISCWIYVPWHWYNGPCVYLCRQFLIAQGRGWSKVYNYVRRKLRIRTILGLCCANHGS